MGPQVVGANNAMGKEVKRGGSRRAVMTPARKTLVETGSADIAPQNPSWNLRFGSANVDSLVGRGAEVVER